MTALLRRLLLTVSVSLLAISVVGAVEPPKSSQRILTLRYDLTGKSEQELVKQGCIRAVRSAIGRIYATGNMLRALNLLDSYVEANYGQFVSRKALKVSEIRGGQRYIDLDVSVDTEKLYADLTQKKFLYRPALRPVFYIFLSETYDGAEAEPNGRRRLIEMIGRREYRYLWSANAEDFSIPALQKPEVEVAPPMPSQDAGRTSATLQAACEQAQRQEVEVFITGSIESKTTRKEPLYFDEYTFVETHCSLKLVRSDTGEILAAAEVVTAAGHTDPKEAVKAASVDAVNKIAPVLFKVFDQQWSKTILDNADLRILVVNTDRERLELLREILRGLSPNSEIYTRSFYEDVALITLTWGGEMKDLIRLLQSTEYPVFTMEMTKPDEMTIQFLPKGDAAGNK